MKAITVENLSKVYSVATANSEGMSFREMLIDQARSIFKKSQKQELFYALKDVSFEVEQGEVLGIIGKNGSGKSTLLKILSKITAPTSGRAIVRGRVASLLEVGTGFHAELTGRENIFMSGIILGMKRWEINQHFDEIVSFAGVEQFLDMPVKKYSSGMRLRLAFSVAAHLQPEILLVDEVLAVGDYEFEKKCLKVMEGISSAGRTILFVSHNMDTVVRLSTRVIYFNEGRVKQCGVPKEIINSYLGFIRKNTWQVTGSDTDLLHTNLVQVTEIKITNLSLQQHGSIDSTEELCVKVSYRIEQKNTRVSVILYFYNDNNDLLFTAFEAVSAFAEGEMRDQSSYTSCCTVPKNIFREGCYSITVEFANAGTKGHLLESNLVTRLHSILSFSVSKNSVGKSDFSWPDLGIISPAIIWNVTKNNPLL